MKALFIKIENLFYLAILKKRSNFHVNGFALTRQQLNSAHNI